MKPDFDFYKKELAYKGFAIVDAVYTNSEAEAIISFIEKKTENPSEKNATDLFAIRKIFTTLPGIKEKILNNNIKHIISAVFGSGYFIIKGLYFDKPSLSNWFVAYHQDLSVSVSSKINSASFKGWTIKNNQFGVQPPLNILEKMYTIRIHLDDCSAENGALHVIPGSHKKGVHNLNTEESYCADEMICEIPKGGVMLMQPLLLHASRKSTVAPKRRVLHIEFCNTELPDSVQWAEKEFIS